MTVDEFEVNILKNAEYWTAIYYADGGMYRYEYDTFAEAANRIRNEKRGFVFAVKHPNGALAATVSFGTWSLSRLRKVEHPLKDCINNGELLVGK